MNNRSDGNQTAPSKPTRSLIPVLTATVLILALAAGCASRPQFDDPAGGIPPDTELALSPNGQQLLVSWRDQSDKPQAKLLALSGTTVTAMRDVSLPGDTFTTSWGRSDHDVVLTTWNGNSSELLRVDLRGDVRTVVYKSALRMRFPLEVAADNHVFLEATEVGGRYSQWQRLQGGQRSLLDTKIYSLAAPLDHVQDSLFLLEPSLSFRGFQGKLPAGLRELVTPSTFVIRCADISPLTCVRTHLLFGPSGRSFGTMEIVNDGRACAIGGQWVDERSLLVARDGRTVVFHAAPGDPYGPRAIYVVKNDNGECLPVQIKIAGGKS